jgi:hypothetical protein
MNTYTESERRIDAACLILFPLAFIILAVLARMGFSHAYFSESYVMGTELVSAALVVVLPFLRITGRFRSPYWFVAMITSVPFVHSASLFMGFYQSFEYWDIISHSYSSFVVGLVVFIALLIIAHYTKNIRLGSTRSILMLTFVISWGFGSLWETSEWIIDNTSGNAFMSYSVIDTLKDLIISDPLGALILELVAWAILRRSSVNELVAPMNLDRYLARLKDRPI